MKIGLGTVQFGVDYGISNIGGKTEAEEVSRILRYASEQGVQFLDTAATYGQSEIVLGKAMPSSTSFSVVTKAPPVWGDVVSNEDPILLDEAFQSSLEKLGELSLYGLLVHHAGNLLLDGGEHLFAKMQELKGRGLVKKIGVSVYDRETLERVCEQFPIDLIQVPLNVFDQRLLADNYLAGLKKSGVEIHARSAFLQGLLLMETDTLPAYFSPIRELFCAYRAHVDSLGVSPLEAALGFVNSLDEVDVVLCGVNNLQQLKEIIAAAKVEINRDEFSRFAVNDEAMINPVNWK